MVEEEEEEKKEEMSTRFFLLRRAHTRYFSREEAQVKARTHPTGTVVQTGEGRRPTNRRWISGSSPEIANDDAQMMQAPRKTMI